MSSRPDHDAIGDADATSIALGPEAGDPGSQRPRWSTPSDKVVAVWTFLAILVVILVSYRWLFRGPVHFGGDEGNQFGIARDSVTLRELRGGGSRTGFHHPGPGFFYVWGLADVIRSGLGIPIGRHNAQMLGADVFVAGQLTVIAMLVRAHLGSILQGAVVLTSLAALALDPGLIGGPWLPHLYYVAFALLIASGASAAAGRLASLPVFIFAGCMLVHGHIAFTSFVGVATIAVLITLWRRGQLRELVGERRTLLWISLGIVAAFAAPIVVYTLRDWPGEFGLYLRFLRDPDTGRNGLGDSIRYTMQFWPGSSTLGRVALAAGACGSLLAASIWRRSGFGAAILGGAVLMELCLLQYAISGVDDLTYRYAGIWAYALPGLVIGVALALVLPAWLTRPTNWIGWVCIGALVAVGAIAVVRTPALDYAPVDFESAPRAVDRITEVAGDRTVLIDAGLDDIGAYLLVPAILSEAEDRGVPICFLDPDWEIKYGEWRTCTAAERRDGARFSFYGAQDPLPRRLAALDPPRFQSAYMVDERTDAP